MLYEGLSIDFQQMMELSGEMEQLKKLPLQVAIYICVNRYFDSPYGFLSYNEIISDFVEHETAWTIAGRYVDFDYSGLWEKSTSKLQDMELNKEDMLQHNDYPGWDIVYDLVVVCNFEQITISGGRL